MPIRSPKHGLTLGHRNSKPTGWQKKVKGRAQWICSHSEAPTGDAADTIYEKRFQSLWSDEPPPATIADAGRVLIRDLANAFLDRKRKKQESGKLGGRSYDEYEECLQLFRDVVAKDEPGLSGASFYDQLEPGHFARFAADLAKRFGPDRQKKFNIMVRSLCKWAAHPPARLPLPDYGDDFALPSRVEFRRHKKKQREKHGAKLFEPSEIRTQIKKASPTRLAMIYLALNAGFGNTDMAELPLSVVDLDSNWIDYARGKTGADRKAWLWDETIKAIRAYLKVRPEPARPEYGGLLFLTRLGHPFVRDNYGKDGKWKSRKDRIGQSYIGFLRALGQYRKGRNWYSLRRTYRTTAFEVGKELVIDLTMGHCEDPEDMSRIYTVNVLDDELKKIALHVRHRLLIESLPSRRPSRRAGAGTAKRKRST